jgi:CelD/BcsL family acetyltransferase involved in cellulose biosynthesis
MISEIIIGSSVFEQLADEWDKLVASGMTDTPFQTLAYQEAWWKHLRPPDSELISVATRNINGGLVGIGCFFNAGGALHFNGCVEETDYLDLITPAEHAEGVWQATLDCLEAVEDPPWSSLELCNIPAASPTHSLLPAIAASRGYSVEEDVIEVCPIITLPDSFDAYLEGLESKQRRELSRKLRRAEGAEVTTTIVGLADDLRAEVDSFLELLQRSAYEKRDWLNEGRRALFHDVAQAARDAGTLQLMFTAVEGRRAAALFNFDYKDRIWVYNSGLDPTAFSALSPGVVLTATAIEQAIKLGRQEFDFLRGDEEYKYRFGAVDTQIYRHRIARNS